MPFVKLDCGILNSTLWHERTARELFITALLMAEPFETLKPLPQISVTSLELTGFIVPPGWYGFVSSAGIGILKRAGIEESIESMASLIALGEAEPTSRTPEFGGRRLVRVDGGFIVLNYMKYREKDASSADRSRRWRERQRLKRDDTPLRNVIRHQAEAEAEADPDLRKDIDYINTLDPPKKANGMRVSVQADAFTDPETTMRAGAFIKRYQEFYKKHRSGARYAVRPARDYAAAVTLCETWPDDRLDLLAAVFLRTDNDFAEKGSRTIPQFLALASWCDGRLAEYEAKNGKVANG